MLPEIYYHLAIFYVRVAGFLFVITAIMMRILNQAFYYLLINICLIFILIQLGSCNFSDREKQEEKKTPADTYFNLVPPVPENFKTPVQKANYLTENYWNNFDFSDSLSISNSIFYEQAFASFLTVILQVSPEKAARGTSIFMSRAEANKTLFLYFLELAEKYLYNPNSPFQNEILYEPFLSAALSSDVIEDIYKIRIQYQFDMVRKNKPGQKAADFNFSLRGGKSSSLYNIKSKLLLIYFYNPDCLACKITIGRISQSSVIEQFTNRGILQIISLYPDEDLTIWDNYYTELPAHWINAYDEGSVIIFDNLYDLKAIPAIYLLDENKTVILRDADFEEIEAFLLSFMNHP